MRRQKAPLVSFRIPLADYESLEATAKASGQSMSEFLRNAVAAHLEGPLVEYASGGGEIIVELPDNAVQRRTRNVVPSVSTPKTTGEMKDLQVTVE